VGIKDVIIKADKKKVHILRINIMHYAAETVKDKQYAGNRKDDVMEDTEEPATILKHNDDYLGNEKAHVHAYKKGSFRYVPIKYYCQDGEKQDEKDC
jgi:hypothetical protein